LVIDTKAATAALIEEREKLVHQLAELGANDRGELTGSVEFGEGFADAAAATAERSEVLGLVENLKTMVEDVDEALERIEAGTYGQCKGCGKDIGAARMEFRPTSRYCVDCKAKKAS
jgi:DnaK suppressor protein